MDNPVKGALTPVKHRYGVTYTQLTQEQRYQISALLKMGHQQSDIAITIGVHKSTISRELRRNRGQRGYRPKQAHRMAMSRRNKAKPRITTSTWAMIESLIREDWSPEQISGWLKTYRNTQISHERIYQYILADKRTACTGQARGGSLYRHLRCQKKRRKRYGSYDRRGKLPNRVSIDERPKIVDSRQRIGDWEVDTLLGKGRRHALVTLTERKSRLALLGKVERKTAAAVADKVIDLLESLITHTLTADNGKEFAEHQRISEDLLLDVYFAHPYAAWERGANENMNGLIRQYIPKDRDLVTVSEEELETIMNKLNHRPRKCLDFLTPHEVFFQQPVALMS